MMFFCYYSILRYKINLYNDLLAGTVDYPDVQAVFRQLQAASLDQHLPAFQRCAN